MRVPAVVCSVNAVNFARGVPVAVVMSEAERFASRNALTFRFAFFDCVHLKLPKANSGHVIVLGQGSYLSVTRWAGEIWCWRRYWKVRGRGLVDLFQ